MPEPPDSPLTFDTNGLSLIAEIVDSAIAEAKRLGMELPADPNEARKLLTKRVLIGIEVGETDKLKLRDRALAADLAGKDLPATEDLLPTSLLTPI
jgi:hypothetical protein